MARYFMAAFRVDRAGLWHRRRNFAWLSASARTLLSRPRATPEPALDSIRRRWRIAEQRVRQTTMNDER